jgi:hypothetical protein
LLYLIWMRWTLSAQCVQIDVEYAVLMTVNCLSSWMYLRSLWVSWLLCQFRRIVILKTSLASDNLQYCKYFLHCNFFDRFTSVFHCLSLDASRYSLSHSYLQVWPLMIGPQVTTWSRAQNPSVVFSYFPQVASIVYAVWYVICWLWGYLLRLTSTLVLYLGC